MGSELENPVFWRSTFERERGTVEIAAQLVREAEVLIDVGANSGFFSLLAKAAAPGIRVIAIEASPFNFEALSENIAANGFDIVAIEAAATAHDGDVTFHDLPTISYSARVEAHGREGTEERRVPGFTLDIIASENDIAGKRILIKIDVEGHEVAVLECARDLIASGPYENYLVTPSGSAIPGVSLN